MTSRIARVLLLTSITASMMTAPAAAATIITPGDPFPAGACVRVSLVDPKPVCVIVDPTA